MFERFGEDRSLEDSHFEMGFGGDHNDGMATSANYSGLHRRLKLRFILRIVFHFC